MRSKIILTAEETSYIRDWFRESLDWSKVRYFQDGIWAAGSSARTLPNRVYLPGDFVEQQRGSPLWRYILIHETTHVWQFQNFGLAYIPKSLAEQLRAWLKTGSGNAAYRFKLFPEQPLRAYGIEQQADIQACAALLMNENNVSFLRRQCTDWEQQPDEERRKVLHRLHNELGGTALSTEGT